MNWDAKDSLYSIRSWEVFQILMCTIRNLRKLKIYYLKNQLWK